MNEAAQLTALDILSYRQGISQNISTETNKEGSRSRSIKSSSSISHHNVLQDFKAHFLATVNQFPLTTDQHFWNPVSSLLVLQPERILDCAALTEWAHFNTCRTERQFSSNAFLSYVCVKVS